VRGSTRPGLGSDGLESEGRSNVPHVKFGFRFVLCRVSEGRGDQSETEDTHDGEVIASD
jgi:hypothetical protein